EPPHPELLKRPLLGPISREWLIYLLGVVAVFPVWWLVQREPVVNWLLLICAIAVLIYFVIYMIRSCTRKEAQRIILALILIAASVLFWTLFELAGSALNQFAERNTQMPSNGFFTITSGQTQSFNAGFILLFAPIFAAMWAWIEKNRRDPGDAAKFALALVQVGAGFLVLVWGAAYADESAKVPLIFLVLLYLLHTTGEMFLSPVGLSAMTKLAPAAVVSTIMATWFLSSSAAQAIGAQIAKATAADTVGGQVLDPQAALATYVTVFQQIGWAAVGLGVLLAAASPFLNRLAPPAHAPQAASE
ncbi:MAG: oligopeptide:H+ symporter, partial [Caulobacterales bacterium]